MLMLVLTTVVVVMMVMMMMVMMVMMVMVMMVMMADPRGARQFWGSRAGRCRRADRRRGGPAAPAMRATQAGRPAGGGPMRNGLAAPERGHLRRQSLGENRGQYLGRAEICVRARFRVFALRAVQAGMQG